MSANLSYFASRLMTTALIVLGAMLLLFVLSSLVPGDPATALLGPQATPEYARQFVVQMGLDKPWYVRLPIYLRNVFTGDLGRDLLSGRSVVSLVGAVLPYTFVLAFTSLGLAIVVGVPLGAYAGTHRGSALDTILTFVSVAFIAIPGFVIAIALLLIFSISLDWLPVMGAGRDGDWRDQFSHLILPMLALSLTWVGFIARLMRSSMIEVLDQDYIRTMRAYGVSRQIITYKYALKNACIPTIAVLGIGIGRLLGGAILVEIVFARPGLGRLIYDAILSRNFPVLQGAVLIVVLIFALANLAVDLSYSAIDPRIGRRADAT